MYNHMSKHNILTELFCNLRELVYAAVELYSAIKGTTAHALLCVTVMQCDNSVC